MEENQIITQQPWTQSNIWGSQAFVKPTLREMAERLNNRQISLRKAQQQQSYNEAEQTMNSLMTSGIQSNNKVISSKSNKALREKQVAYWIQDYYSRTYPEELDKLGINFDTWWNDSDTIKRYLKNNPDSTQYIKDYITTENNTNDPMEFYNTMWWIEKNAWDKIWDWTKTAGQNFLSFFESWGDVVRNAVNMWIWALEWDQTPWALENYARMNYGKDFYSLSETEKAEARQAISTQEWLDMYKPTAQRIALKWWEAVLDAAFTFGAPRTKAGFSVAWATAEADVPWVSDVLWRALGGLDKVNGFLWWIVSEVPWLSNFRDSLQTEQEKAEFDNILWMIVLWKILQKRWWRIKNSTSLKKTVMNELDPVRTAKEIQDRMTNAPKDIKNAVEKQAVKSAVKNTAKNEAWLREIANVVWQWEATDIDSSVKAMQNLWKHVDLKSLSTFQEIDNAWHSTVAKLSQIVDENLEKYTWKVIKASDQKFTIIDWKEMWKVVDDAITDLKDVYTKQRNVDWLKDLADFENKFQWEWVSYKELNDFAREYGTEMDSRNAKNQLTTDAKVWTERTRSGIKDLIRERVPAEEFKDIDAEIWSISNFRKLIQKSIEKANSTEQKLRDKWVVESVRKAYSDIKGAVTWAPRWETENIYHIQERLPKLLKEFDELNTQLEKANKAEAEKLIKWFNSEINPK